jgi:hypothetical protein
MRWRAAAGGTSGAAAQTLRGHTKAVNAVAFSPDRQLLPAVGSDTTALPWEVPSGRGGTAEDPEHPVVPTGRQPGCALLKSDSGGRRDIRLGPAAGCFRAMILASRPRARLPRSWSFGAGGAVNTYRTDRH